LLNITSTGEFVVNLAPADLLAEVTATGTDFPPDVSKFDEAGLTRAASKTVTAPRVSESPVSLECRLHSTLPIGDCFLVFGKLRMPLLDPAPCGELIQYFISWNRFRVSD
jgi:flavin reductase (DIM6/NTAB) family NADH-FMN oxidoreductase RutF